MVYMSFGDFYYFNWDYKFDIYYYNDIFVYLYCYYFYCSYVNSYFMNLLSR